MRRFKKALACLITVLMVILSIPTGVVSFAAENTSDFLGGEGTAESPYLISNKRQLNKARNYGGAHFKLINSIDFNDADFVDGGSFYNDGKGFEPIPLSANEGETAFFDGDGYYINNFVGEALFSEVGADVTVSNLKIYGEASALALTNYGKIENCNSCIEATAAGIAVTNYGTISACYNTNSVYGKLSGGIASENNGLIENCYNTGSIQAAKSGGIAGLNNGIIRNCYNTGYLSGRNAGGIVYLNCENGAVENCYYCNEHGGRPYYESDVAIGCSYDELSDIKTFMGWDFQNVWEIDGYCQYRYPQLKNNRTERIRDIKLVSSTEGAVALRGITAGNIGGMIRIFYEDGNVVTTELTGQMLPEIDYNTLGEQSSFISYGGVSVGDRVTLTVIEKNSVGISVDSLNRTDYILGQSLDINTETFTVHYENGEREILPLSEANIMYDENAVGEVTVTVEYGGFADSCYIYVSENNIKYIEFIEPAKLTYYLGEAIDLSGGRLVVTYGDNSVEEIPLDDGMIGGYSSGQFGFQNISLYFMGYSFEFTVRYMSKHNIEGISASPIKTLTELSDGYYESYWDENGENRYFRYYAERAFDTFTVIYDGGQVFTGTRDEIYEKFSAWININTDQSPQNPWGIGKHSVKIEFIGTVYNTEIEITENPINAIYATQTVPLVENVDGNYESYWENDQEYIYFNYNIWECGWMFTVEYDGGKLFTGTENELYEKFGANVTYRTNQNPFNQWTVGQNPLEIEFMGVTTTAYVVIEKNPIESVTAVVTEDIIEKTRGYYTYDWNYEEPKEYFEYRLYDIIEYTVTYDGGQIFIGDEWELSEKFGYYPSVWSNQSYDNQWGIGAHTAEAEFMGYRLNLSFNIIPSPIEGISAVATKDLAGNIDGYLMWEDGDESKTYFRYMYEEYLEYTITYDGGKSFTGNLEEVYNEFGTTPYLSDTQSFATPWEPGINLVEIEFINVSNTAEITVTEPIYESIEISGKNRLTIIFNKTDGTTVEAPINDFEIMDGDVDYRAGRIYTDLGEFTGVFTFRCEWDETGRPYSCMDKDIQLELAAYTSNILPECNFLKIFDMSGSVAYSIDKSYSGIVNSDNINDLIYVSTLIDIYPFGEDDYIEIDGKTYAALELDKVKGYMGQLFDIKNVDFSLALTDPETGKILIDIDEQGENIYQYVDFSYDEIKDCWTSKSNVFDWYTDTLVRVCDVVWNSDGLIEKITVRHMNAGTTGDFNGDGIADVRDLIKLKKAIANEETEGYDLNGDGLVNAEDLAEFKKQLLEIEELSVASIN